MSAVMKEMAVTEPKSLAEILVISGQIPVDFYKNTAKYQAELDSAIATAQSLVHPITDEGRKLAKADAAVIRKYAKTTNGFSLSVFRSLTDKVKIWKDEITGKTKLLENEADNIMSRFEKIEHQKLDSITELLANTLAAYRIEIGLRPGFYGEYDLTPMVKLTGSITESGKLTAKALSFIKAIADSKLALQNRWDSRILTLENRCLRADINPPLTHVHLGAVMVSEDEVFNAKVDELITAEIERRAEMAASIERQNAAANQKKVDDALALQKENNRIEMEKMNVEAAKKDQFQVQAPVAAPTPEKTPDDLRRIAKDIVESAERAPTNEARNREMEGASKIRRKADELEKQQAQMAGKKTVTVIAQFQITVRSHITPQGVADHLKSKLPDDLVAVLVACSGTE